MHGRPLNHCTLCVMLLLAVGRLHHLPKERIPVAAPEPAAAAAGAAVEKKARSPDMTRT